MGQARRAGGWSPREASDGDDVVGEGDHPPIRAGSLALAGFELLGVPFVGAQVEPDLERMSRERLLPYEKTLEKVARYEAHLSRGLYKALHEL